MRILSLSLVLSTILPGSARAEDQPSGNGAIPHTLAPCPTSPNCVTSQGPTTDSDHAIAPLPLVGNAAESMARLKAVIAAQPRTRVVRAEPSYLHAEFTSLILRFVDDVEFLLDANAALIHVRSASRVGYSDMGANRRRVEALRAAYLKKAD